MESVNKNSVPGMQQEPTKAEQSASLDEKVQEHLANGGTIKKPKPVNRKRKKRATVLSGGVSSATLGVLKNTGVTMSCWAGYGVKIGQKLTFKSRKWTSKKPVHAEIANLSSMQLKIFVNNKEVKIPRPYGVGDGTAFGVVGAEAWVRAVLCGDKTMQEKVKSGKHVNKSTGCLKVSACEGWDAWFLPYKGKEESIHARYKRYAG